jgi:mRNA-degrading endonuclease RelE of RelBE toxin-antitoxin system
MYELILNKHAAKAMDRMSPKVRGRIFKTLEGLKEDPWQGKRLHGELEGLLSLRFRLWRIVYEVDNKQQVIIVHGIGPRGDIYKG